MYLTRIERRVEKLDWWLNGFLFYMEKHALKFPHKIYKEWTMSKMCQSNRLNTMEITNIYTNTYIYFSIWRWVSSLSKIIIKKDLVRCQYGNIKNCGIVDASYKNWKEDRKAWLMVRWFLIFCGKFCF